MKRARKNLWRVVVAKSEPPVQPAPEPAGHDTCSHDAVQEAPAPAKLPDTASAYPLFGLIGLGSVIASKVHVPLLQACVRWPDALPTVIIRSAGVTALAGGVGNRVWRRSVLSCCFRIPTPLHKTHRQPANSEFRPTSSLSCSTSASKRPRAVTSPASPKTTFRFTKTARRRRSRNSPAPTYPSPSAW